MSSQIDRKNNSNSIANNLKIKSNNKPSLCLPDVSDTKYDARTTLNNHNINVHSKIASTLQGSIYRGILLKHGKLIDIVIKRAEIELCKHNTARFGGKVHENIIKETKIMKYIETLNPPKGFLRMHDDINDGHNYFLIMDFGGKSLFDHVRKYHDLISKKLLNINEWKIHVKIIFNQLVRIIEFLHNKAKVCHMDISLENILIKGCVFNNGKFTSHGQVYFCDYGLAEYFGDDTKFLCTKYVGKTIYQAPEVFGKKDIFDARKADIWSLGIILFMLVFGVQPLKEPSMKDSYFRNIINGYLSKMIHVNNKGKYASKWCLNIMNIMLTLHNKRSNINTIINTLSKYKNLN